MLQERKQKRSDVVSTLVPMFNHILISGTTTPSSTITVLVFAAPVSITHAFDIPAPYVVLMDSCCTQTCLNVPRHHGLSRYRPTRSLPFTHLPRRLAAKDTDTGSSTGTFDLLEMTCGTAMGETSDVQLMRRNHVPRWMTRMLAPWRPCTVLMLSQTRPGILSQRRGPLATVY